jgi:hypothetical protein
MYGARVCGHQINHAPGVHAQLVLLPKHTPNVTVGIQEIIAKEVRGGTTALCAKYLCAASAVACSSTMVPFGLVSRCMNTMTKTLSIILLYAAFCTPMDAR